MAVTPPPCKTICFGQFAMDSFTPILKECDDQVKPANYHAVHTSPTEVRRLKL